MNEPELRSFMKELRVEIRRLNKAAGETVVNPHITSQVDYFLNDRGIRVDYPPYLRDDS